MYNNVWIHSTTGKRPAELINEKNEEVLKQVIKRRNKKVGDACKRVSKCLELLENQYVLIKDNAILEEKTGIWYLPNASGPGKKLKANYLSLATVFAIKENCIVLQIVKYKNLQA